jgi:glycosyltransferase involved in cell wall biosynthesis
MPEEPTAMPAECATLSIVIPIYREAGFLEQALGGLVPALERHRVDYELILVEQRSDQATLDHSLAVVARYPRVRHLLLPAPDFGLAMKTGMLAATGDVVVNFDLDYWDVTFARMCRAIMLAFDVDVVIGSKNARLSVDNRALVRRVISQGFRVLLQVAFGLRVSDTHGIKAWRNGPRLAEQIRACRFTQDVFDTELVIRGERAGFRLLELPVTVADQRPPRTNVLTRVPGAAWSLVRLFLILWGESSRRSIPRGAVAELPTPEPPG